MQESMNGRLLIVDDDPNVLKAITNMLSAEGLSIRTCPDAFSALEFAERERYDAVLSDIMMPAVSGLELLDHIQRIDPDIPVIMMTGFAEFETAITAVKRHAFDFIMKPFEPEILISVIARALNYKRLREVEREYNGLLKTTVTKNTEELKQQIEELRVARDAAMESSRLKSAFMSSISHELRTPLHGMTGLLDLLTKQEHTAAQNKYFEMMQHSIERLTSLINNIINFSSMASGAFELSPTEFALADFMREAVQPYAAKAEAKGLMLRLNVDGALPQEIVADRQRLNQVLANLLDNAVKFTQQGELSLELRLAEKGLSSDPEGVTLFFSVSDTGIGIAPDKVEHIFEGFSQADNSFTRKYEGAGLGLTIARQTIQSMGGSIWVESRSGNGSTFNVVVPVKKGGDHENTDS